MHQEKREALDWFSIILEVENVADSQILLFYGSLGPLGQEVFVRLDEAQKKIIVVLSNSSEDEILEIKTVLGDYSPLFHNFANLLSILMSCYQDYNASFPGEMTDYVPPNLVNIVRNHQQRNHDQSRQARELALAELIKESESASPETKAVILSAIKRIKEQISKVQQNSANQHAEETEVDLPQFGTFGGEERISGTFDRVKDSLKPKPLRRVVKA